MTILVKKNGAYAAPSAILVKKNGVYSAVTSVLAKISGAYQSVNAALPVRIATTQNWLNDNIPGVTGKPYMTNYWGHVMAQATTDLRVRLDGWYVTTGGQQDALAAYVVDEMFAQFNGVSIQLTKGGLTTWTINPGDVDIQTDPIAWTGFGATPVPGSVIYTKAKYHNNDGEKFVASAYRNSGDGLSSSGGQYYNPGVTTVSTGSALGPYTVSSGTAFQVFTFGICPHILGTVVADKMSVIGLGDSRLTPLGESGGTYKSGRGVFQKAANNVTQDGAWVPCINYSIPSSQYSIALGANDKVTSYMKYCNTAVDEFAKNNIDGQANAAIQLLAQQLWTKCRANGIQKIIRFGILPVTTSTNLWVDTANQTVVTKYEVGGQADQLMAWFQTQVGVAGAIDYYCSNDVVNRDTVATDKWLTDGTTAFATPDGLHDRLAASDREAVPVRTLYATVRTFFGG